MNWTEVSEAQKAWEKAHNHWHYGVVGCALSGLFALSLGTAWINSGFDPRIGSYAYYSLAGLVVAAVLAGFAYWNSRKSNAMEKDIVARLRQEFGGKSVRVPGDAVGEVLSVSVFGLARIAFPSGVIESYDLRTVRIVEPAQHPEVAR